MKKPEMVVQGIVLFSFLVCIMIVPAVKQDKKHTDIVIVGGLGDLAKKYLWQGVFNLYYNYNNENTTFNFYSCGRAESNDGKSKLESILQKHVTCESYKTDCEKIRTKFLMHVKYFPLISEIDFINFGLQLDINYDKSKSYGRIFYMSIPPSAYVSMAEKMHSCCYIHSNSGNNWNRLVLEKPFGSDKESAEKMSEEIGKIYKEEEIFRVDHYLGKSVVKQILPFRLANKDLLEELLNRHEVSRVEVAMKETIGVQGRLDFYDRYGVIRDVMQNHLTELLTLVAMDIPGNISNFQDVEENRIKLLKQINPVRKNAVLFGQYSEYLSQASVEKNNVTSSRFTPTFAAALLEVNSVRWSGVPFVLVSGKHLDERSSFIRIIFKDNHFCIAGCNHHNGSHWGGRKQIIFQIGYGNLPSAGILVSKDLFIPQLPVGLKDLPITADDIAIYGQNLNDFKFIVPVDNSDAYLSVIDDLYYGKRESFVGTQRLMHLWNIWSPAVNEMKETVPKIYQESQDISLNFVIHQKSLEFIYKEVPSEIFVDKNSFRFMQSIPSSFQQHALVTASTQDALISIVTKHIENEALSRLNEQNIFNIAFSGGKTPEKLFQCLAESNKIPWKWVHIWQVDERCVERNNSESNFHLLHEELLQFINIPYLNIHPLPVDVAGRICNKNDNGDQLYQEQIKHLVSRMKFDAVVLGVGADGHTASLFPHSEMLTVSSDVVYVLDKTLKEKRMTMTYHVLNKAKKIYVLVTGLEKHDILQNLKDESKTVADYPILGVVPVDGNLTWYVDYSAWFGK